MTKKTPAMHLNITADQHLPAGAENPWTTWKELNRLRTQVGRSRVNGRGDTRTNQKLVTAASGRPCNIYPVGGYDLTLTCDWWKDNNDDDDVLLILNFLDNIFALFLVVVVRLEHSHSYCS